MKHFLIFGLVLVALNSNAQKKTKLDPSVAALNATKDAAIKSLTANYEADKTTALQIWDFAEVGYKENKSAALHIQHLKEAGFTVETGVAGIPTAFVATYGAGAPAIGILAEYDALPGLAQNAVAENAVIDIVFEPCDAAHIN